MIIGTSNVPEYAPSQQVSSASGVPAEAERPAVAVDVVILTVREHRLEALLVKRTHWPYVGAWAIPGCFVQPNESLEDAARRKLVEEGGARDVYLEQLYTFGEPGRDPRARVITIVYYALLRPDQLRPPTGEGVAEARLFPAYGVPDLAFDHKSILDYSLQRLRGKLEYTMIGFQLLTEEFTLSELQDVYEAILNRPLDKRNFRKKLLLMRIVEPTSRTRMGGQHRPALLYRFNPRAQT